MIQIAKSTYNVMGSSFNQHFQSKFVVRIRIVAAKLIKTNQISTYSFKNHFYFTQKCLNLGRFNQIFQRILSFAMDFDHFRSLNRHLNQKLVKSIKNWHHGLIWFRFQRQIWNRTNFDIKIWTVWNMNPRWFNSYRP